MRPSAVLVALGRRAAISAFLAITCLVSPAWAGDRALIDFIGFSPDFRYFAFEEFGIQDGSGFPYSNTYLIDLSTDSWVVGTPIRVQADKEATTLSSIRATAQEQVADFIDDFSLTVPVEVAALIGDGAPGVDASQLAFGAPGYNPGAVLGNYQLILSSFPTKAASPCEDWFSVDPKGFSLLIVDSNAERLVHRDIGALPRSRGCPVDYRLYGVVMPFGGATLSNAVAIVSYYPGGFEGPDRRFLAVPLGL